MNQKDAGAESVLSVLLFGLFVGITQLIGQLYKLKYLKLFTIHDSGFTLGLWVIPISIFFTYLFYVLLKKTNRLKPLLKHIRRCINYLELHHTYIYRPLRFVYRHPILSGFALGIVIALVELALKYIV